MFLRKRLFLKYCKNQPARKDKCASGNYAKQPFFALNTTFIISLLFIALSYYIFFQLMTDTLES